MSRLSPAVAFIRNAVRAAVEEAPLRGGPVLVACSGGADSMALAAAAVFVTSPAGVLTVDHQLQEGSRQQAEAVATWARSLGAQPVEVLTVAVGAAGGPEAAARTARYEALAAAAKRLDAACVLLGHTEDDQAETVLLALTRGSGPRGLAAMPRRREIDGIRFLRPLLGVSRATCREACAAQGLAVWDDPHNVDPSYTRSRLRADVMPLLVQALGPDVVANLARTADLVAADSAYLDKEGFEALEECLRDGELDAATTAKLDRPIRTRVLHAWALRLGVPGAALSHRHIAALDRLLTDWHGQGPAHLPGGIRVKRSAGRLSAG